MNFERIKFEGLSAAALVAGIDFLKKAIEANLQPDQISVIIRDPIFGDLTASGVTREDAFLAAACAIAGLKWMTPIYEVLSAQQRARMKANPLEKPLPPIKPPKTQILSPMDPIRISLEESSREMERMLNPDREKLE